jgi:hypothetical protein
MKNKESNRHSNKYNIWSLAPKGARHQDELADWPSVVMWLRHFWLSSVKINFSLKWVFSRSSLSEDGNGSIFKNVAFFRILDEVQKLNTPEWHTQSSKPFRTVSELRIAGPNQSYNFTVLQHLLKWKVKQSNFKLKTHWTDSIVCISVFQLPYEIDCVCFLYWALQNIQFYRYQYRSAQYFKGTLE